ncbi:TerD domain-containing protein [Streptomyces sp. OK228]|nr:TerD domain-containing protein [Streptomyces sp. OK228]
MGHSRWELLIRGSGWKARAVGQGYDTGLAGLATDYGIDVET